jgi:hypothetical protein
MLAEKADIPTSSKWNCAYSVSDSDYMSQGFGAAKYAESSAKSRMRDFLLHTADVKIEEQFHEFNKPVYGGSKGWKEWRVMVLTTKIGIGIITRKKGENLKEFVKNCWKSGTNPRVFLPFLRVGIEDELGLDYFGNEKKPQTV